MKNNIYKVGMMYFDINKIYCMKKLDIFGNEAYGNVNGQRYTLQECNYEEYKKLFNAFIGSEE